MKAMRHGIWMILCCWLVVLSGCTLMNPSEVPPGQQNPPAERIPAAEQVPPPELPNVSKEDRKKLVDGNNRFAIKLMKQLVGGEEGKKNIFVSPFSISTALAMTYAGANGKTKEEMRQVFEFPELDNLMHTAFEWLFKDLDYRGTQGNYQLSLANRLWPQKKYKFLQSYFDLMAEHYGVDFKYLDYINETEKSRVTINDWVEEKTQGKIKDLLKPGIIKKITRLVLVNAIYFKGNWQTQFKKSNTHQAPFYKLDNSTVSVPMMHVQGSFEYGQHDGWKILRLPYKNKELSMIVMMPTSPASFQEKEKSLNAATIDTWLNKLSKSNIKVWLPKWKMTFPLQMNDVLKEMGMPLAFSGLADFSGMTGHKGLYIGAVVHKAFLEVNEVGSEAAAATAVVMNRKSTSVGGDNLQFRVDRPFWLLIRDDTTQSILFSGRVLNPLQD